MRIPKKIDDNIKDSIVEIRYKSNTPFHFLLGLFYQALHPEYKYLANTRGTSKIMVGVASFGQPHSIRVNFDDPIIFYNDSIKVQFSPEMVRFNYNQKYPSWDTIKPLVVDVMNKLTACSAFEKFTETGVRYINEYKGQAILSNTKVTIGTPYDAQCNAYINSVVRLEFMDSGYKVRVQVTNSGPESPAPLTVEQMSEALSYVDIHVFKDNVNSSELGTLLDVLEATHRIEKQVFFTVMKDEFIQSKNPVY